MMGSVLQFAALSSICWLIQCAVTQANHDGDKRLNKENLNRNDPTVGDFYFDEQKSSDSVKTGRMITQSAWSKEDEESLPDENKTGVLSNDEFNLKNALSYLLNMIHELKKDIFGIKEMALLKNTKDLSNSQDNSESKVKPKKMELSKDTLKSDSKIPNLMLTRNTELEKKNRLSKSNYIVDYYKNNGIKFVDDDLETSGDESDDSSHKFNEGDTVHEIVKNKDDPCIYKCSTGRKSDRYSSKIEVTANIPMSKTQIIDKNDKDFDDDDFKESITRSSKMKQNKAKTSEETENISTLSAKQEKCVEDDNNDDSDRINRENEPIENIPESTEYATRDSQNKSFEGKRSKKSNPNKTTDNILKLTSPPSDYSKSGKNSKYKSGSDLDDESVFSELSTTLSFQSSKDDIYPENIEKDYLDDESVVSKPSTTLSFQSSKDDIYSKNIEKEPKPTEKLDSKMQQEEIISLNPEDQKQAQNNVNSFKNNDVTNEYTTVSSKPYEAGNEIPDLEISTDTQFEDMTDESKRKRLNVHSSHYTTTYYQKESGSKNDEQTYNSFDTDNPVSATSSENLMKSYSWNKDSFDDLNDKENVNNNIINNDSETQSYNETGQTKTQQINKGSERRKSVKNYKVKDKNRENRNKNDDDNMASKTTNEFPSPRQSNLVIQNPDVEGFDTPVQQKNEESLNKSDVTSPVYDSKKNEDLDISVKLGDLETVGELNQNQKSELATNDINEENNEEINVVNTGTVLTNESQISQRTEYAIEEKSPEQYNTFLEYFYKHSNSPLFKSLRNQ